MASEESDGGAASYGATGELVPPLASAMNEVNNSSAMLLGVGDYTANTTDQSVSSPHGSSASVSLKGSTTGKPPRIPRVPVGDPGAEVKGQDSKVSQKDDSMRPGDSENENGNMGAVAPPLKFGFARLRRSSSSLEVDYVKRYQNVVHGKAVVDLNVAVGDVASRWSSSMKSRAVGMWGAVKKVTNNNKVGDVSDQYSARQIQAVVRIQRAMRIYWYKASMRDWRADNSITFKRRQLLARVRAMSNAHEVPLSFIPYLLLVVVVMVCLSYDQPPLVQNALVGTTVHNMLGRDGIGRAPQTYKEFYTMVRDVFEGAKLMPGDTTDELNYYFNYVMVLSWAISMIRGKSVACGEEPGLPDYYNSQCLVSFDGSDPESAPFGNTTADALTYYQAIYQLSDNSQYIRSADSTDNSTLVCPQFTSSRTEGIATYGTDSYIIELPFHVAAANSSAPLWIVDMLERCEFLHPQSREVLFEMYGYVNTKTPMLSVVIFKMTVDDYGKSSTSFSSASSHLQAVWDVDGPTGDALKVCFALLAVFSFFGVMGTIGYLTINVAQGGCAFATMALLEGFTYVNILQYVAIWAYFMAHLARQFALDSMIAANFENFDENGIILLEAEEGLRGLKSMLMACTILKLMQYVRFRGQLSILVAVVKRVFWTLLHFTGIFVIVLFGCALFGWGSFSNAIYKWSSIPESMNTVLLMIFGDFDYDEMNQVEPTGAAMVTILTLTILSTILMNFFIAIILEGYATVSAERRFKMTIKDEAYSGIVRLVEAGAFKHNIEELMWVLSRTSYLGKFEYVTLFDIRSVLRYDMPQEFMTILLDMRDGRDAERIYAGPYKRCNQHRKIKIFWGSQIIYPVLLGFFRSYDLFVWCGYMQKRLALYRKMLQKKHTKTRGIKSGIYNIKKLKAMAPTNGRVETEGNTSSSGDATTLPSGEELAESHATPNECRTPSVGKSELCEEDTLGGAGSCTVEEGFEGLAHSSKGVPPYLAALAEKVRRLEAMLEAGASSEDENQDTKQRIEEVAGNTLTRAPPIVQVSLSLPSVPHAPVEQSNGVSGGDAEMKRGPAADEQGVVNAHADGKHEGSFPAVFSDPVERSDNLAAGDRAVKIGNGVDETGHEVDSGGVGKDDGSPFYKDG